MFRSEYTFVDLFSGAGGFTEGLLLAGGSERRFKLVAASDVHKHAAQTHQHRFHGQLGLDYTFLTADVRNSNFVSNLLTAVEKNAETIDVVVGGPPCQGFSVFGARNENDPRNDLFRPYLKAIAALQPKYFIMENVPGFSMMYGGEAVRQLYRAVEKISGVRYRLAGPIKVNTVEFGVPQLRERVLFIGSRSDVPLLDHVPSGTHQGQITAKQALDDLSFLRAWESNGTYHASHPAITPYQAASRRGRLFDLYGIETDKVKLTNHDAAKHSPDVIARFAMMEPGMGFDSIPRALWDRYLASSKKWCVRLHPDRPSYTVTTLPDDFVHYAHPRILTAREWARLQSFDDTFEFLGPRTTGGGGKGNKKRTLELPQYTQIGNAVPPLLAKGIGMAILSALDSVLPIRKPRRNDFLSKVH